ncbi:site-specific DNA-methyltransferase [Halomonas sp. AOP12-C2-37]|uniref:site-specific DNA-methyltransferase n=1 Tax=unclassified Halomonas TaxID=2609666 RepID=UPI0040347916
MSIEKQAMKTKDFSLEVARAIANLVPESITESKDDDGKVKISINYQALKNVLGDLIDSEQSEKYQLSWPGKSASVLASASSTEKTLRPERKQSLMYEDTKNTFIEGDNLEALKLLRENYLGQVDVIYIDPPYNTGSDLIYNDKFVSSTKDYLNLSGQVSGEGEHLTSNLKGNGRFHSDWLTMIFPRLRIARQLLSEQGIIFISIDDNERANLQKICEEIFGTENFIGCFIWKRRSGSMDSTSNLSEDHEYVLVYSRFGASLNGVRRTFEKYSNPDDDPRGPWISDNLSAGKPGGDTYYSIVDPNTGSEYLPPKGRYWPYSRITMAKKISEGRVLFPKFSSGTPMLKRFSSEAMKETIPVSSWIERPGAGGQSTICCPMNSSATRALKELLGSKVFSFPKPVELVQALVQQGGSKDALVLDFFAGSSTTAHAVLNCNANDGGRRRFILVQIPEAIDKSTEAFKEGYSNIAEVSKERIRRAGQKILEGDCHSDWNRDVGFRVLKVDTSNMKDIYYRPDELSQGDLLEAVDNIKPDRTPEDLLFQVLVDWGVDLTLPIRSDTLQGKTVFFVDDNALVACFDSGVTEDLVKELAKHEPLRVVFRDNGFASDAVKINVEQIFRQLSPSTEVKTI